MTERKTFTLYLAVNQDGDTYVDYTGVTTASDAIQGLIDESGAEATRVVKIEVTLDLPTVETVNVAVTVPAETKSPAQVTLSQRPLNGSIGSDMTADELESLIAASKGGNVPGITEDHRFEMMDRLKALRSGA